MYGKILIAISAFTFATAAPVFAGCEEEIDALSKAISGPVTMAAGHRAAMMRMAVHGYDQCMAGDPKSSEGIRDQISGHSLRRKVQGQDRTALNRTGTADGQQLRNRGSNLRPRGRQF